MSLNKSSMFNWHPVIAGLPIPQPITEFVLSKENWWQYLAGERLPDEDIEFLKAAIARLGGYPVFMRTDLSSGKHNFVDACYVHDEDRLIKNLFGLVEQNALHDLWFDSIAVREFIPLDYEFHAFNGLPIAREMRYFVRDGVVICHHPYWIEEAIRFYQNSKTWEDTAWRQWLKDLNTESEGEVEILTGYAKMVASVLPGAWSVDFARSKKGDWYLIDMAVAEQSWHPPCENKLTNEKHGS